MAFVVCLMLLRGGVAEELSPAVRQRVEALVRSRVDLPPAATLTFTVVGPSELPGFDKLSIHFESVFAGSSGDIALLVATDGSRVAQLSIYDVAANPRGQVPFAGRPGRGGPVDAPVVFVGFDDLECPFCAVLHKELFPALTEHYGKQVRVVYQSFPSDGHPWAMHAAIDTDCLGEQSSAGYWAAVDAIHAHAGEYGGSERKLALADEELDAETMAEGRREHVDEAKLKACVVKQDNAAEKANLVVGAKLGVAKTPTFFINGVKFEGDVPIEFVFDMVDEALKAAGQVPPARVRASGVGTGAAK